MLAPAPFATLADYNELAPAICRGLCAQDIPADRVTAALELATDLLVRASANTYVGKVQMVARPSVAEHCPPYGFHGYGTGCCTADPIPFGPNVTSIDEVMLDGGVLTPNTDYRVATFVGRLELYRMNPATDRPRSWPSHQHQWRLPSEDKTFQVKFTAGSDPDLIEISACIEMACYVLSGTYGTGEDVLRHAVSASGGGLTVQSDGEENADASFAATSQFLARWNPSKTRHPSSFWSPDVTTWNLNIREIAAA